jgi:hypothetical protein
VPRILRSRALKIVFGSVYSLLAAEFFLRVISPMPLLPRYVVATPYGVRANQPSVTYYHTTPECYVKMETNSHGIRSNREIPYEKPAGVKRIVVLGDSYGMGYEVDLDQMFLSQLEARVKEAGVPCEVVNLSVSGHGNAEELLALRAEGFKYQPDLVLVCWHSTDLDDNVRSGLFKFDGDRLVADKPAYLPGTNMQQKLAQFALYRFVSERCQLYSFLREELAGKLKALLLVGGGKKADAEAEPTIAQAKPSNPSSSTTGQGPDGTPAKLSDAERLSIALLEQARRESIEHHANFLVLDIPDFGFKNAELRSAFPRDPEGKDFGLRVVSPLDAFHSTPQDQQLYRHRGHFHLTPIACQIVGDLLARVVLKDDFLGKPPG